MEGRRVKDIIRTQTTESTNQHRQELTMTEATTLGARMDLA